MELSEAYREVIRENVEYGILAERYGEQWIDETVEVMLEVALSKRPYIRIAGDDFSREVVRSRFCADRQGYFIVNDIGNFIFALAEAAVYGSCKSRKQKFVMSFTINACSPGVPPCRLYLTIAHSLQGGTERIGREAYEDKKDV